MQLTADNTIVSNLAGIHRHTFVAILSDTKMPFSLPALVFTSPQPHKGSYGNATTRYHQRNFQFNQNLAERLQKHTSERANSHTISYASNCMRIRLEALFEFVETDDTYG